MTGASPLLVVLTGPTGTGKSELALRLAEHLQPTLPLEIVSVDSAQVYRGMDIGTAKPTLQQRAGVPHHLIDIRDAACNYSAGEFVRDASSAIAQIEARGHQPLLVGGTMLYLRALYQGLATLPAASASIRHELDQQARQQGWPALHAQLAHIDPAAAARIAPQDAQRIQRALEVYQLTGTPISQRQRDTPSARERFRWLRFALWPEAGASARQALREQLERRLARMLESGLLEEVRRLYERGDLTVQHAAIRAVGYRQLWQVHAAGVSVAEAQRQALIATAQLAKRQLTWLRREPDLIALSWGDVGLAEGLAARILAAARA